MDRKVSIFINVSFQFMFECSLFILCGAYFCGSPVFHMVCFIPIRYPNEPAFIIPDCLQQKVSDGHLGRKSGQGFYVWNGERRGDPVE